MFPRKSSGAQRPLEFDGLDPKKGATDLEAPPGEPRWHAHGSHYEFLYQIFACMRITLYFHCNHQTTWIHQCALSSTSASASFSSSLEELNKGVRTKGLGTISFVGIWPFYLQSALHWRSVISNESGKPNQLLQEIKLFHYESAEKNMGKTNAFKGFLVRSKRNYGGNNLLKPWGIKKQKTIKPNSQSLRNQSRNF